jgi:hypothetical protein
MIFARKSRIRDAAPNLGYRASCRDRARESKTRKTRLDKQPETMAETGNRKQGRSEPARCRMHDCNPVGNYGHVGHVGNRNESTLELTCLRIDMPRKPEQRDDANWTGDQKDGQHHTPRNILLPASLSDMHRNGMGGNRKALLPQITTFFNRCPKRKSRRCADGHAEAHAQARAKNRQACGVTSSSAGRIVSLPYNPA